jgi:hypothetical protein
MALNRWKAAGLHLACSALIGLVVLVVITQWWIPAPYFQAMGATRLILLILAVDVVLGPLLTLVVFNLAKPELKRDLAIIAILQVCAFSYGIYAATQARPVYLTFAVDRFEIVTRAEVDGNELKSAPQSLQDIVWGHPRLAWAKQPDDPKEREALMFSAVQAGIDLKHFLRHYQPFEEARAVVQHKAKPLSQLSSFNPAGAVQPLIDRYASRPEVLYLPVQGKQRDLVALVDSKAMALIEVLELQPWH